MSTKKFLKAVLSVIFALSFTCAQSQEEEHHKEGFQAGEMIMHHIADAHEVHFIGDIALYLPIIIIDDGEFHMFSSSHFYHNEVKIVGEGHGSYYEHDGYILSHEHIYRASEEGGLSYDEAGNITNVKPLDMSITKSVLGMFIAMLICILLFGSVAKKYKKNPGKAPSGLQSWLEPLIVFIRDEVVIPSLGEKKADRYMPFLMSTFFFIWVCNIMGLIPFIGGFNITGTLGITIVLAVVVFVITTISGNKHYWGHILWPSGVPLPIKLILVPIEIAQIFIKPAVLMVRLSANITAGHIIMLAFVSLIFIFGEKSEIGGWGVGIGSTAFMVFMFFIELLVAFLQAYVFTLLTALYLGQATEEAHH